jgi:hypothetical protein
MPAVPPPVMITWWYAVVTMVVPVWSAGPSGQLVVSPRAMALL